MWRDAGCPASFFALMGTRAGCPGRFCWKSRLLIFFVRVDEIHGSNSTPPTTSVRRFDARAEGPQCAFGFDRWGFCAASINWRLESARTPASAPETWTPRRVSPAGRGPAARKRKPRHRRRRLRARLPERGGPAVGAAETGRDAARS